MEPIAGELCHIDDVVAIHDVHGIVIVDVETTVVVAFVDSASESPWSCWAGSGVDISLAEFNASDPIPETVAVAVTHSASPGPFDICGLSTCHIVLGRPRKGGNGMSD